MAQKFVSPGVFTSELDQSFLAQGVGAIGAVVIGQTLKGPAFKPTVVSNFQEFSDKFGTFDTTMQLPYAAKNYLKNAGTLTVVRVLGDANGTGVTNGSPTLQAYKVYASSSLGSGTVSQAILFTSGTAALLTSSDGIALTGSTWAASSSSIVYGTSNHWSKIWNTDPKAFATKGHFLYALDSWNIGAGVNAFTLKLDTMSTASFKHDYTEAVSSYVQSQMYGSSPYNLFKFHTKADGTAANTELKVSIENVKPSINTDVTLYGTFDISVRTFGDTDQRPQVVEKFTQCTMDPNSAYYVARVIGDQYEIWNSTKNKNETTGTFASKSKYVRIEMADPSGVPADALPFGHAGYPWFDGETVTLASGAMPFILNQTNDQGNIDPSIYWGIDFGNTISDQLKYVPTTFNEANHTGALVAFNLGKLKSGLYQGQTTWSYDITVSSSYYQPIAMSASVQKFVLPLRGGFDGLDPTSLTPMALQDSDGDSVAQVVWLKKGIAVVSNPDQWDFNVMSLPGVTNWKVNSVGRQVCNDRADALFIQDIPGGGTSDTIGKLQNQTIDDNYAACYYPDVVYNDKINNRLVTVKPSVAVLGAIAYNDRVGQPFFAPAGLNRGGLGQFDVVDVTDRLTYAERSDLYEARINPIAYFPVEGIVVFGQKTLQVKPSALDRINVRRLLIYSKKLIASAAKYLLFEPNNPNTWQRFLNTVNPILDRIRQDQGIERFKVVMDSTVNTPDLVDRNIMTGKIFLQPTRSAEFIDLAFIITSSGVSFEE